MPEIEIKKESAENNSLRNLLESALNKEELKNIEVFLKNLKLFLRAEKSIDPVYLSEEDIKLWCKFEKDILRNEDLKEHSAWANKHSDSNRKRASLAMSQHIANMLMIKYGGDWPEERLEEAKGEPRDL